MTRLIDLTGKTFGKLIVLSRDETRRYKMGTSKIMWKCRCACGTEKLIHGNHLRNGKIISCGCRKYDGTRGTHRLSKHPSYPSWNSMINRCTNPNDDHYAYYGGRGIKICERWKASFPHFIADMGPRPTPQHTLDRIDTNGNYEPSNCRWATRAEQSANTRRNRHLTFNGKTMNLTEWAKETGVSFNGIRHRLAIGWSIERTLTTPSKKAHLRSPCL